MSRFLPIALLTALFGCTEYDLVKPGDAMGPDDNPPATSDDDDGADFDRDGEDDPGDDPDEPDQPDEPLGDSGLMGRVCDPAGADWVVGARVYIDLDPSNPGTLIVETVTDADGWFTFEGLPAGSYTVYIEKGSFSHSFEVELFEGERLELEEAECLDPDSIDIAVVTGEYDDIGHILNGLGVTYDTYEGTTSTDYYRLLRDPALLAQYDIVFINCGVNFDWLTHHSEIGQNLATYVQSGGSLYASDWAYYFVEASFGNAVDFYGDDAAVGPALVGDFGYINASVDDPVMQTVLGQTEAELYFDFNNWAIPEYAGANSTVLLTADAPLYESNTTVAGAPMAIRHEAGDGQVLFTSFHNEQQNTLHMDLLLREIVLSL